MISVSHADLSPVILLCLCLLRLLWLLSLLLVLVVSGRELRRAGCGWGVGVGLRLASEFGEFCAEAGAAASLDSSESSLALRGPTTSLVWLSGWPGRTI